MDYKKFKLLRRLYKRNDPYVIPASQCDVNCFYCSDKYSPEDLKSNVLDGPISEQMFDKLIKFMDPHLDKLLIGEGYLNGGQFTTHPLWKKFLSKLQKKLPDTKFRMRTGHIPTRQELSFMAPKIDHLTISVNSLDPQILSKIKNSKTDNIKDNLRLTAELELPVRIFYLVIPGFVSREDMRKDLQFLDRLPNITDVEVASPSYTKHTPEACREKLKLDERKLMNRVKEFNEQFQNKIEINYLFLSFVPEEKQEGFYKKLKKDVTSRTTKEDRILLLTSEKIHPIARSLCKELNSKFGADIHSIPIENNFYGGNVNVGGLLTVTDFLEKETAINDVNSDVILTTNAPFDCDGFDIQGKHKTRLEEKLNAPVLFI